MLKAQSSSKFKGYEKVKKIGEGTFATVYLGHAYKSASDSEDPNKSGKKQQITKIAIKRIKVGLFQGTGDIGTIFKLYSS
jgi:hypothetical protein